MKKIWVITIGLLLALTAQGYVGEGMEEQGKTNWYAESIGDLHNYIVATQGPRTADEVDYTSVGLTPKEHSLTIQQIQSIHAAVLGRSYELWIPHTTPERIWGTIGADALGAVGGLIGGAQTNILASLAFPVLLPLTPYAAVLGGVATGSAASINYWYGNARELPDFENPNQWLCRFIGDIHNLALAGHHEGKTVKQVMLDYGFKRELVNGIKAEEIRVPKSFAHRLAVVETSKGKTFTEVYQDAEKALSGSVHTLNADVYLSVLEASYTYWTEYEETAGGRWDWDGFRTIWMSDAKGAAIGGFSAFGATSLFQQALGVPMSPQEALGVFTVGAILVGADYSIDSAEDYYGE